MSGRIAALWILAVWLVWGVLNATRLRLHTELPLSTVLWYGLPDAVIWAVLTPLVLWICARYPIRRDRLAPTLALHFLLGLAFAVVHSALDTVVNVMRYLATGEPFAALSTFGWILRKTWHLNFVIYLLVVGFVHFFGHARRLAEEKRQTAELRAQLSEARLQALRSQLQPHFLFNALHTVSGLMVHDVEEAQAMLRRLGELLRASLDSHDRSEIPLDRELALARAYLDIERSRFRDRLETRFDAPVELMQHPVPPFILQPLVENAMRHGVGRNPDGGEVAIAARRRNGQLEIEVRDDGAGADDDRAATGTGVGLTNVRTRLNELYRGQGDVRTADLPGGGYSVTVSIPWSLDGEPA